MESELSNNSSENTSHELTSNSLMEREYSLRKILNENDDSFNIIIDKSGTVLNWSRNAELLTGYAANEIIGQSFSNLLKEEERNNNSYNNNLKKAAQLPNYISKHRLNLKDGLEIPFTLHFNSLFNFDGGIIGFTINVSKNYHQNVEKQVFSDIGTEAENQRFNNTGPKLANALVLEKSEKRFKAFVENGEEVIVVRDKDHALTYASPSFEKVMGYTFEEAKNFPSNFVVHPDDLDFANLKYNEIIKNPGIPIHIERYRVKQKNGNYIWISGTLTNLLEYPAVEGVVHNFRDISKEITAAEKQKASERYFKALVENGMDGIVVRDKDTLLTYVSPSYERLMGYTFDEAKAFPLHYLSHPDDSEYLKEKVTECLENPGKSIELSRYRARHKNGKFIWLTGFLTNLLDDPAVNGFVRNFRVIEEEVAAAEKLQASEKRFKALVENGTDGIVLLNDKAMPIYFTQGYTRILGYRDEDKEILPGFTIIHPDDLEYTRSVFTESLQNPNKLIENINYRAKHKNGHFVWLSGSIINFINDKSIGGIVHNFRDVSYEKRAIEMLQRSEKHFKALVENGTDGILVLDIDRKPIYTSPTFFRIMGYSVEEFQNIDTYDIIHPDDLDYAKSKMFESLVNPGLPVTNIQFRVRHKTGNWIYLAVTLTNFLMEPAIRGIVNNFRDITEEKELHNYQLKLYSQLQERNSFIEAVIENIPIGISVNRIGDQKLTMINKQFYSAYGWNEGDFDDVESFFNKVYPDENYRKKIAGRILEDINSGDINRMKWDGISVTTKNGEKKIINARNVPLYGQNLMLSIAIDVTEEAKKTEEIKRIKANQEALINGTNDFIWSVDRNMCIITQNNVYNQFAILLNGKPVKEGESALFDGLGLEGKQRWKGLYERGLTGEHFTTKTSNFDKVKQIMRYALISVNPMRDVNNEIFGVSCYVKDITDDTLNTIELERTKTELEKILDTSLDIICTIDKNSIILRINKASEALLGYAPDELVGKHLFDFVHPDDLKETINTSKEVIAGREITNFENKYITKDGKTLYISWTALWDPIDEVRYGFGRNVTEKKEWENKLVLSEAKYKSLFEFNPLPLFFIDSNSLRILDCNKATLQKYGYSKEEFQNLTINDIRPIDDKLQFDEQIRKHLVSNDIKKGTWRHQKKNGDIMFMDISTILVELNGEPVNLVMANDITESHYYHELDKIEKNILEMNTRSDRSISKLIGVYLTGIESLHPGMFCSILEKKGNYLYNLASPSLDPEYLEAINELPVQDNTGSCCTAVFLKKNIITEDIQNDKNWDNYKSLAERFKLSSCWSSLIWDGNKNILGTFACYYKEPKKPSVNEKKTIERAVNILQIILESYKREKALQLSNERFEYAADATTDIIWDWDLETNGVYYSGNMTKLFGHKAGIDYNNLPFYFENVHPDDRERVVLYPDQVKYGTFTNWTQEYRFRKADGEYAYVLDKALVIRDENGLGIRMVGAIHDVTRRKREEQRLKLLESVVTNTTDAVMITEAKFTGELSPRILYINDAFTKTTGYTAEDIIGKSPRILQGPKTDLKGLQTLDEAIKNWEPIELTAINYKKNGEEFWNNFSVVPVTNEEGAHSHWISIERDVTKRKNEELQKELLQGISSIFNENETIKVCLNKTLELILEFGNFGFVEFWLVDNYKDQIILEAQFYHKQQFKTFANANAENNNRKKGDGLPGRTWQTKQVEYWNYKEVNKKMRRYNEAVDAGIKRAYSIPLLFNDKVIGTLALILDIDEMPNLGLSTLFDHFSKSLGAEIKRKQLEEELNQIFLFTPDILCMVSTDGYFIKINPSMSAILEYPEKELLSRPFFDFIHPDDREKTAKELNDISEGIPNFYIENRYITKTGKVIWIAWTTTGASEKGIIFCSGKDITEKKEVEVLLHNATTLARIGAWEIDVVNDTIQWSDITREIHETEPGFNPDRESAINFYKEGTDRKFIIKTITEAIRTCKSADVELRIITAKGNLKWVRVIVETEFIDGVCRRVFGSIQDINERKQAELLATEALIERNTILESIGDAFFAVNKNWEITYWNKVAARVLGKSRNKVINKNILEVFNGTVASEAISKYQLAVDTNQAVHFEIYDNKLQKWFEISAYPSSSGLSVYFKDITDRKLADSQFLALNENLKNHASDLAKSNAELEQFAYVASHDLQEPLRMVTSFLMMLENKYSEKLDDKGKQYIFFAVDGAKRMRQLILDLLEFSRVGRMDSDMDNVDINILVTEIMTLYKKRIDEEEAHIKFDKLPVIKTFRSPLRQVMQNLISNGLKYHRPGVSPIIRIKSKQKGEYWQFEIKDNGIGIKSEYFEKVFVIFQRLHTKEEYSGTGMGLAIAKKIIENLGGKIWVESELGIGTSFFFTIPKKRRII